MSTSALLTIRVEMALLVLIKLATTSVFVSQDIKEKIVIKVSYFFLGTVKTNHYSHQRGVRAPLNCDKPSICCFSLLDVDECQFNPCKHGGTCSNIPGSYNCKCVSGYKGKDCKQGKKITVSRTLSSGHLDRFSQKCTD